MEIGLNVRLPRNRMSPYVAAIPGQLIAIDAAALLPPGVVDAQEIVSFQWDSDVWAITLILL